MKVTVEFKYEIGEELQLKRHPEIRYLVKEQRFQRCEGCKGDNVQIHYLCRPIGMKSEYNFEKKKAILVTIGAGKDDLVAEMELEPIAEIA